MRMRNVRPATPTVIIQQAAPAVELVERQQPLDQQNFIFQLAQMVSQQQAKVSAMEVQTFDVKEAAQFLRVSTWSIYDLCRTDSIPYFKVKSRYFFRRYELEKWISGQTNECGRG
jgi:hypothetical protein